MTQTTDRDAADTKALAQAVRDYLATDEGHRQEADVAFEGALLDQGVMSDHEELLNIDPDSCGIIVRIGSDRSDIDLFIDIAGNVCVPNESDIG